METVENSCGQSGCHQILITIVSNSLINTLEWNADYALTAWYVEKQKEKSNLAVISS